MNVGIVMNTFLTSLNVGSYEYISYIPVLWQSYIYFSYILEIFLLHP